MHRQDRKMDIVKNGIYKHYKGNKYLVLDFALHSETLEELVIYKALYGDGKIWARPASMWNEKVEYNGKEVLRFVFQEENK